ncbi:VTT domain-containing protein [Fictibacillus sp. KIGAM418]|uniref:TVP38/TMEM64 family membrane protein n=1 Tax=Fictibacillus marinisediminis TaxID=2878389 RepID=A0A9X1X958_9BACL|nr:VTT domain-containing protein [Fictibacillus marinisediminis]MCK6256507.1 VTT domain-containing protein [Fictibacillus marinisediminis]
MSLKDLIIDLFTAYENIAFLLSIGINMIISLLGVVPSVFLTAANLTVFGFGEGMAVSFIGEAFGAVISFILYRKGFRKAANMRGLSHPKVKQLLAAEGKESFYLILALRLLPFVPSGIVTFIAAIGKTSLFIFVLASSIGKVPAILIEGYSIYQIIHWTWEGKLVTAIIACVLIAMTWKKVKTK